MLGKALLLTAVELHTDSSLWCGEELYCRAVQDRVKYTGKKKILIFCSGDESCNFFCCFVKNESLVDKSVLSFFFVTGRAVASKYASTDRP